MHGAALRDLLLERIGTLTDEALAVTQPAVRLSRQIVHDDTIPTGASKIGGRPDLPPGFVWPERHRIARSFLAQMDLAEVAPQDAALAHQWPVVLLLRPSSTTRDVEE